MFFDITCKEIICLSFSRIKYDSLNHVCNARLSIIYDKNTNCLYILTPIVLFDF
jgi:hypothetical protein